MSAETLTAKERDLIEATLDRAPGCPDKECRVCREIAAGKAAWAKALRELERAKADRDDYEQRWLAECRAHGETRRALDANAGPAILGSDLKGIRFRP